jgi:beta-galactosidase/beta-glucuronidase
MNKTDTSLEEDLSLDGEWDLFYSRGTEETPPRLPNSSEFSSSILIPGYWDDQLERFEKSSSWSKPNLIDYPNIQADFNREYRPIHFPIRQTSRDRVYSSLWSMMPDASLPNLKGTVFYRRKIHVPIGWKGRIITLKIGGAILETYVYLNGVFVGKHIGHSTPFEFQLENSLLYDKDNELVIAVSNIHKILGGCALRGYHGYSGGIYRSVKIHVSGSTKIHSLFIHPSSNLSVMRWRVELNFLHKTKIKTCLDWRILSLDGKTLREGSREIRESEGNESFQIEWDTPLKGLKKWSFWEPNLYLAELILKKEDVIIDRLKQPFGLRVITRENKHLLLNGRPIFLRGICDHYYFAPFANAPNSKKYYIDLIRHVKRIGFNFIRCHTWVPPKEYMEAADELGVTLQVEMPDLGINIPVGRDAFKLEMFREIVERSRIHPSVMIYCGGNEQTCNEELITFLEKFYSTAKELDPTCLVMPQESMRGIENFNFISPLPKDLTEKPFLHHSKRLERITKCSDVLGSYSWGYLSYFSLQVDCREIEKRYQIYHRPILSHEIGIIGCYIDLNLENRYTDRIPPDLYTTVRQNLEANNKIEMSQTYYRNSARWQSMLRKHVLEKARKTDSLSGYNFLGGWDSHWHRTGYARGILHEFFEL